MRVTIEVELTPWRESSPPGMRLRSWLPLDTEQRFESCGAPGITGAAAVATELPRPIEHPEADGRLALHRYEWRVWTPVGHVWPYRGGTAKTLAAAMADADKSIAVLVGLLKAAHV